jgi:hypothetical protein
MPRRRSTRRSTNSRRVIQPEQGYVSWDTLLDSPEESLENEVVPLSMSENLAGIVLPDSEGRPVRLGSLWANQPAVIAFLRHYG